MKVLIGSNPMNLEVYIPKLKEDCPQVEFTHCDDRNAIMDVIADADIYLGWLSRDIFLNAKKLKWIQSPSSGVDYYLAIPELVESEVLLTSASGTHGACLSESAFGMIFAFTRGIRDSILHQQNHSWGARQARSKMVELTGSTMGIIGFGKVGCSLAVRAQVFGMRVLALDINPVDKPECVNELWMLDRLDDLLRESDYVVVTAPRTPQTLGMIGAEQLALMKPTAMIIGISRGGIIDQEALAEALREKRLAAAALDVFSPEPLPPDSELWDLDNLLITPHIAGGTQLEGEHIIEIFCENLRRFLQGDLPLRNQVDKQRGF
jgi:phosphoglycerate dehydrogenase-like enzyme